ncbi:MAG: 4Fe-4S dicluster domain-containing protein [Desulfobacteraceae bacterium]|jgi:formate dehydrogenase iron-sulfur subunit
MIERMGFFTDTTVCIGCKACEVACKQWNRLQATHSGANRILGYGYDNTLHLDGFHWRHVRFIERFNEARSEARWLMMSDACKHCTQAPCIDACPEYAIKRTEFDTVVIDPKLCKGYFACAGACPFGVIEGDPDLRIARKCTLCYDRLKHGMIPACAQTCPTDSIQFGPLRELIPRAEERVKQLHELGETSAYLYGVGQDYLGGLGNFYLLIDRPEVYALPQKSKLY